MIPTLSRIFETLLATTLNQESGTSSQYRKLPFDGKHVSRDSDLGRPTAYSAPHVTTTSDAKDDRLPDSIAINIAPHSVNVPEHVRIGLPQIIDHVNESFFEKVLEAAKNHTYPVIESSDVKSEQNSTEVMESVLDVKTLPANLVATLPHITNQLNESYFNSTLRDGETHGKTLVSRDQVRSTYDFQIQTRAQVNTTSNFQSQAKNQINATYSFQQFQPQAVDITASKHSTDLGLTLVGFFIIVGFVLYAKFVRRKSFVALKEGNKLDMEEKGFGKKEETIEVDATQWSNIVL